MATLEHTVTVKLTVSNIPRKIAIGPLTYTIQQNEAVYNRHVVSEGNPYYGRIDHEAGTIHLAPDQTTDRSRMALLHEIVHGCIHIADPRIDAAQTFTEETFVSMLSGVLLDTMQRNPDIVAFLCRYNESNDNEQ